MEAVKKGKTKEGDFRAVKRAALLSPSSASTISRCTVVDGKGRVATVARSVIHSEKGREKTALCLPPLHFPS